MNLDELNMYRNEKDHHMRHGYEKPKDASQNEVNRYVKDMFGGPSGIDPNSHGVELQ